jgi:2-polyprenyl-3-methyl-5-hydroxy-6-metoxy-1,4-benzoquinol methylase
MSDTSQSLTERYDRAAGGWGDKMRTLGYYDGYLGFLSSPVPRPDPNGTVLDVGCGSGSFAEAWVAMHGTTSSVTLLDPSRPMLNRAAASLGRRGVSARSVSGTLEDFAETAQFDHLLAAHVIEHCPDPKAALHQMRHLAQPGGTLWLVASKPHWCNAIIWVQWRHRTFQDAEIAALLSESGWSLHDTYAFPSGPPSRTSRGYLARAI